MTRTRCLITAFLLAGAAHAKSFEELTTAGTPEEQGSALIRELAARNAGYRDLVGEVDMTLTDADGAEAKRNFTLKLLERASADEGDRSLIVFESPADVKGTAVLSHGGGAEHEDEQWLYLPSARRTKRISSSNRSGAFVGSEFTFEDLTGNDARKYAWKLGSKKTCGAGTCVELEATPKDATSAYSKRLLLVDTKDLRVKSIDFFDRKGTLLKTLAYEDFVTLNDRFTRAQRWTMRNAQTNKTTTIRFTTMKLTTGLTQSDFSTAALAQ